MPGGEREQNVVTEQGGVERDWWGHSGVGWPPASLLGRRVPRAGRPAWSSQQPIGGPTCFLPDGVT